nr:NUDIX domain-containing protein [Clavibacter sp. VKM Ac-2872]
MPNVYGIVSSTRDGVKAVLIQRRWKPVSDPLNSGRWELPGGKWRAWESAHECLRREVLEESGIELTRIVEPESESDLNDQSVIALSGASVVQMVRGPYPSAILVLHADGEGSPLARGDGSRDAQWMAVEEVAQRMKHDSASFTPLTFAALASWLRETAAR